MQRLNSANFDRKNTEYFLLLNNTENLVILNNEICDLENIDCKNPDNCRTSKLNFMVLNRTELNLTTDFDSVSGLNTCERVRSCC